jgi:hypothetical protein
MIIPLGEWLPDLPVLNNPGLTVCTNVFPGPGGAYTPVPGLTAAGSQSAIGAINNGFYARDAANNTYTYAGDSSALYVQVGQTFNVATRLSVSNSAVVAYNVDAADCWEFVSWGQTVIAVDGLNDVPQQISLGAAHFANLTGAPKARHIAVIKDFVVLGNVSDSAANVQRVRWSGINNSAAWSVDATTLADFQDLPGNGGWVQKIISGEQGYVFQERAIWRMTFVGSPLIFQFDKIHDGIGAYAAQGVANYENYVFFLASDGFKVFDGSNVTPIGEGKVDATFLADLDINYIDNIKAVVFPELKCVFWAYAGIGNTGGKCNHIMVYSWAYKKWARIDFPADMGGGGFDTIAVSSASGYTLEGLDAVSSSLDALAFSLDSREWTGGALSFSAWIGTNLYYFTATPLDTELATGDLCLMQIQSGTVMNKAQLNEIWPITQGTDVAVTVAVGHRENVRDAITIGNDTAPESAGFVQSHVLSRYHRFIMKTTGDFEQIQGLDVIFVDAGKR